MFLGGTLRFLLAQPIVDLALFHMKRCIMKSDGFTVYSSSGMIHVDVGNHNIRNLFVCVTRRMLTGRELIEG